MGDWNTSTYHRCRGCGKPLTTDEQSMCIYGRGSYHVRCDPTQRPNKGVQPTAEAGDPESSAAESETPQTAAADA